MKSNETLGIVAGDRGYKVSSNGSLGVYDKQGKLTLAYGKKNDLPNRVAFVGVQDVIKMTPITSLSNCFCNYVVDYTVV